MTSLPVVAQQYPTKPVRIVVPYTAAGGADTVTRALAQRLTDALGQQIVVDNRAGANGIIGTELVARAAPDGHTVLLTTNAFVINPWLYSKMPYTEKDFAPITIVASAYNLLAAHVSVPARSVKELLALARARPAQITMATGGIGQPSHLAGELFRQMAKVDITVVPYKATGASLSDLAGGQVMLSFSSVPSLTPLVQAGRLRALAVSGTARIAAMPEVPTVAETVPGFNVSAWYGLLVPAGTPRPVIDRLYGETKRILGTDDMRQFLAQRSFEAGGMPPEAFAEIVRADLVRWQKVIKDANIRVE